MTDQEYVESTVAYLAEHVPWMWHKFAAWMLREVCQDQPPEGLAIAELHERWKAVSRNEWRAALIEVNATGPQFTSPLTAEMASLKAADRSVVSTTATESVLCANTSYQRGLRFGRKTAGYTYMGTWLCAESNPKGNPLISADWWEERGEPMLAELLRREASEAL